jgi:hypothetical protein
MEHPTVPELRRGLMEALQMHPSGVEREQAISLTAKKVKNNNISHWRDKWNTGLSDAYVAGLIRKRNGILLLSPKGEELLTAGDFHAINEIIREAKKGRSKKNRDIDPEDPGIESVVPPHEKPPTLPPTTQKENYKQNIHRTRQWVRDVGGKDMAKYFFQEFLELISPDTP